MEIKNLYPYIFTRKSSRDYDLTPLPADTIKQIETFISEVRPLIPNAEIQHKIVGCDDVKGVGVPKAPHFILISAKEQPLRNTCAGFHFQHVELYLYSLGLAARWLGSAKGKQADPNHVISIAFGKPATGATRTLAEFKRKSVAEIAKGTDPVLMRFGWLPRG